MFPNTGWFWVYKKVGLHVTWKSRTISLTARLFLSKEINSSIHWIEGQQTFREAWASWWWDNRYSAVILLSFKRSLLTSMIDKSSARRHSSFAIICAKQRDGLKYITPCHSQFSRHRTDQEPCSQTSRLQNSQRQLATCIHGSQSGSLYVQRESATECECVSSAYEGHSPTQGARTVAMTCPSLILEVSGMYICCEPIILIVIFLNFSRQVYSL
jgi:hypothetical protein